MVSDRPAYMECYDGHSGWANSKALAAGRHHADTPDPPQRRDRARRRTGEPTGALKESATALVDAKCCPQPDADARATRCCLRALRLAQRARASRPSRTRATGLEELAATVPLLERALARGPARPCASRVRAHERGRLSTRAVAEARAARRAPPRRAPALRAGEGVRGRRDRGAHRGHARALRGRSRRSGRGTPNWKPAALERGGGGRGPGRRCRSTCTRSATAGCAWRSTRTRPRARRTAARTGPRPHRAHRDHRPRRLPALPRAGRHRLHAAAAREPGPEQRRACGRGTPGPTGRAAASPGATSSARAGAWSSAATGRW